MKTSLIVGGFIMIVLISFGAGHATKAPQPGWITRAKVVSVYDGDTLTIEVTRRMRVRLLDCWCPEIRTRDKEEKERGLAAKAHLSKLLPEGSEVVLQIPSGTDLGKSFTFGRVLGNIWADKDAVSSVSEQMVDSGHATAAKKR